MSGVKGMRWGQGLPDSELRPCGTLAAYRRHLRRGDPVDRDCRQAVDRDRQDRVAAGWQRPRRQYRRRVHLARRDGLAACGRARRGTPASGILAEVTCRHCLAILRRHQARGERSRAA